MGEGLPSKIFEVTAEYQSPKKDSVDDGCDNCHQLQVRVRKEKKWTNKDSPQPPMQEEAFEFLTG